MEEMFKYEELHSFFSESSTPAYIYFTEKIRNNISIIKKTKLDDIDLAYAMKANPKSKIIRAITELNSYIMCSSASEIKEALCCGVKADNIVFISPGKTYDDLYVAAKNSIYMIILDSEIELIQIGNIANQLNRQINIGFRINNSKKVKAKEIYTAPHFGMGISEILSAIRYINNSSNLVLKGFHCCWGTQISDENVIINSFKEYIQMVTEIMNNIDSTQVTEQSLLFSLGIGVDYYNHGINLSVQNILEKINSLWKEFEVGTNKGIKKKCILIAGRFLVANAGYYIAQIIECKEVYGKAFLITNGGTHQISPTFMLGKFLRKTLPVYVVGRTKSKPKMVTITGNLLTPTDLLAENIVVEHYLPGDYLVIPNVGAYGKTFSVLDFLSHDYPNEIVVG